MIVITDKTNCCGCQACANSCPKGCISMQADEEGFLYPYVDKQQCVNCGICEKVCPILNKPQTFVGIETYAAKHRNKDVKLRSSSGGVFTALAEVILKEKGVVFGASFDRDWNVVHTYVDTPQELDKLRRSKYVQSNIGKTYQQAKNFLDQGRKVLFTGTPCQIAGLRNYLGKEYENLLTAELFCHGVPSPGVWQKFLRENFDVSLIQDINFRTKQIGWNRPYLSFLLLPHGAAHVYGMKRTLLEIFINKLKIKTSVLSNSFFKAFLRDLISRPICHVCPFRTARFADFCIGDLWGVWPDIITQEDETLGVSAVIVNTAKAQDFFNIYLSASMITQRVDFSKVAKANFPLLTSPKPHPKRADFFARYQAENFNKLAKELLNIKSIWITIPRGLTLKIFHKILNLRSNGKKVDN